MSEQVVATVNVGSSTVKAAVYEYMASSAPADQFRQLAHTELEIGSQDDRKIELVVDAIVQWLAERGPGVIGHRVVHGGPNYSQPVMLTESVLAELGGLTEIDPTHMPQTLAVLRRMHDSCPKTPQVVCFDTAFHRRMPQVARNYPLPGAVTDGVVIRYGFHGLSCESIMAQLRVSNPDEAEGRVIIAHLGSGSSMTAVREGSSVETTMGFTPTGGLMMGTRSGDLDPGVIIYLLRSGRMTLRELSRVLNEESGLLAVSGTASDMRTLVARKDEDERAAAAIEMYCYQARKFLAALAAALGGVDTIVFAGGIGENSSEIRRRILEPLRFVGVDIDAEKNTKGAAVISIESAQVKVRVMHTNEELVIARHAITLRSS